MAEKNWTLRLKQDESGMEEEISVLLKEEKARTVQIQVAASLKGKLPITVIQPGDLKLDVYYKGVDGEMKVQNGASNPKIIYGPKGNGEEEITEMFPLEVSTDAREIRFMPTEQTVTDNKEPWIYEPYIGEQKVADLQPFATFADLEKQFGGTRQIVLKGHRRDEQDPDRKGFALPVFVKVTDQDKLRTHQMDYGISHKVYVSYVLDGERKTQEKTVSFYGEGLTGKTNPKSKGTHPVGSIMVEPNAEIITIGHDAPTEEAHVYFLGHGSDGVTYEFPREKSFTREFEDAKDFILEYKGIPSIVVEQV